MQQQMQESLLKTRQIQQSQHDLSDRVAALKPKLDSLPVSHASNPLFAPQFHDQRSHYTKPPFKMEVSRFDGTDVIGWIF